MRDYRRLYASNLVNTFGSWLTFLAIALVIKDKYGANYVALVFLVQTLPSIIFSRTLATMVPVGLQERVYAVTLVLLAMNSAVMVIDQSLPVIFIHLLIGSLLRSLSTPIFNSLIGKWVPRNDQREVYTRVGALQAGTLALAPILGAWMKVTLGVEVLFAVDALTFLVSLALLKELFSPPIGDIPLCFKWRELFAELTLLRPKWMPEPLKRALNIWFLFLGVGAILNAIEFPGFELARLSEKQIGFALAGWGGGSLLAFVLPGRIKISQSAFCYIASLAAFVFASGPLLAIASFFAAGAFSSYFSGALRGLMQSHVPDSENPAVMWAYANQVTQMINLVAYGSAGVLLGIVGFGAFAAIMLLLGLTLAWLTRST